MTDVLPGRHSAVPGADEVGGREGFVLDELTKQLLRQLATDGHGHTTSEPLVDWDVIWSLAQGEPSERLALGRAVLGAEEVRAGMPLAAPSALLARPRSDVTEPRYSSRTARQPVIPRPVLSKKVRRAVTSATWVRNVGIIIVLFAVWQLWGTGIAEAHSQSQLGSQYQSLVRAFAGKAMAAPATTRTGPAAPGPGATKPGTPIPTRTPSGGTGAGDANGASAASARAVRAETMAFTEAALPGGVLGRIRIPAIGVSDYFVQGVGEPQLQEGPGRYPGSGLPGQIGNLAIAGHRTTYGAPFFRLGQLRVGDHVVIDVPEGRATYTVSQPPFAVYPWDVSVLADYGDARVTLTTCNPPFFATTRLIVVAKLTKWLPTGSLVPAAPAPVSSPAASAPWPHAARVPAGPEERTVPAAQLPVGVRPTSPGALMPQRLPLPDKSGRAPLSRPALASGADHAAVGDQSTVGPAHASSKAAPASSKAAQALSDEDGWHWAQLPLVLGVVFALCALGVLYNRMAVICAGASRWLVMAPMWAAGLLVLFKVLGLLLPADL